MLIEGCVIEVLRRDPQRGCYVVTDAVQPHSLLVSKRPSDSRLLFDPGRVALSYDLRERDEFAIRVECVANQRHEISE